MVNDGHTTDCTVTGTSTFNDGDESDEDFGKFECKGESLLTLVQPELSSLAEHWLAALRDHALLMLPPGNFILIVNFLFCPVVGFLIYSTLILMVNWYSYT